MSVNVRRTECVSGWSLHAQGKKTQIRACLVVETACIEAEDPDQRLNVWPPDQEGELGFPVELAWFLTPFPQNSFGLEYKPVHTCIPSHGLKRS